VRSEGFVRVLASRELPAGEGLDSQLRRVRVGRASVLVARRNDGRVVAFATRCPHEATDLEQATLWDGEVRCPKHNYIYDPLSGQNLVPRRGARPGMLWKLHPGYLPTHAVEERDGWIWVREAANPPPPGWDPAAEVPPPGGAVEPPAGEPEPEAEPAPPPVPPPAEHPVKRLRVRLGAEFELRLPTTPRPGHVWRFEVPPQIQVVRQAFEPGDPPRQRVRLAARAAGEGTVRCLYGRPWEREPAETRSYVVEVVAEEGAP
jgi:nitrite reductase/ring-hydroxylating ferredoxin subunit/predicted secreted protein